MNIQPLGEARSKLRMGNGHPKPGRAPIRIYLWLAIAALIIAAGTQIIRHHGQSPVPSRTTGQQSPAASASQPLMPFSLPTPDQLRQITPEEAVRENAERPFSERPDTPAGKFVISADALSRLRAVDCLAQAIYYEAASEGTDGGRAVAQVVLNRMHHPAFPSSVCGVVYQGAERVTGCQFSFTCDGSLARVPVAYLWLRSMRIAQEALAGSVYPQVGHATFYHADYVLPYWADTFDKVAKIGRHIFYRFRGGLGEARSFSNRYAGAEPTPPLPPSPTPLPLDPAIATTISSPVPIVPFEAVEEDKIIPLAKTVIRSTEKNSELAADINAGQILVDTPTGPSGSVTKSKSSDDCQKPAGTRLKASTANDLRATARSAAC